MKYDSGSQRLSPSSESSKSALLPTVFYFWKQMLLPSISLDLWNSLAICWMHFDILLSSVYSEDSFFNNSLVPWYKALETGSMTLGKWEENTMKLLCVYASTSFIIKFDKCATYWTLLAFDECSFIRDVNPPYPHDIVFASSKHCPRYLTKSIPSSSTSFKSSVLSSSAIQLATSISPKQDLQNFIRLGTSSSFCIIEMYRKSTLGSLC